MKVFKKKFTKLLQQEIDEALITSSKSMGLQTTEFAFHQYVKQFIDEHLVPLVRILFPEYKSVASFDDVYSKLVRKIDLEVLIGCR